MSAVKCTFGVTASNDSKINWISANTIKSIELSFSNQYTKIINARNTLNNDSL